MSYIDDLNQAAAEALAASSSATDSAQIMFDVANGGETTTVTTAGGEVKTLAKAIKDIIDAIEVGVEAPQVEPQTLSAGQTTVTLSTMTTEGIAVYVEGSREFDFTVVNSTDFNFSQSFPDGTRIWIVKREVLGTFGEYLVTNSEGVTDTLENWFVESANAKLYRDQAQTAKDSAESARDAAQLSAGVYASIADGLAGTTEGDYFSSPSAAAGEYLTLYLHDAGGVATKISTYPSKDSLEFYESRAYGSAAHALVDSKGRSALYVGTDGVLYVLAADILGSKIDGEVSTMFSYLLQDEVGNSALGIRSDGRVEMKAALVESLQNVSTINGKPFEKLVNSEVVTRPLGYTSEINGISSYGQSLAVGSTSLPVISTTQDYDNLMFSSGVRTQDGGTDPNVIYSSLAPLVESDNGLGLGETPMAGATDHIKSLIASEDGLTYTGMSYQMLGTAPGEGGTNIAGLSKGTSPYQKLLDDITYSKIRAGDEGKSYAYQATTWMQGEADYSSESSKDYYKSKLSSLVDIIASDVPAITNQTFPPEFISYQVGSHLRYAKSIGIASAFDAQIAQAQLETSLEKSRVHLACPMYPFDYSGTVNQVHLTATDERVVGGYFGLVYKRVVIDGEEWSPLLPISITRSDNAVYITMHVPRPPLVIDTTWVSGNTDYGFRVFDGAGSQVAITSVSIVNGNSVKLSCADLGGGPVTVDYALSTDDATGETGRQVGARGNIRDSQGDDIVFDSTGVNRPLHNWLVMFKHTEGESTWL